MNRTRSLAATVLPAVVALVASVGLSACSPASGAGPSGTAAAQLAPRPTVAAARTSFPGLVPSTGEPEVPGLRTMHPAAGQVLTAAGPFDDRFEWRGLGLDSSGVHGSVHVTSDVSDVLELQVVAAFYDARGTFLGLGRWVHHLDEDAEGAAAHTGPPSEDVQVRVAVPAAFRGKTVAAAVGVPVLVNE